MTACNQQIVTAFETLGMTPEEIADDQDLDLASIKSILMQSSSLYRKACKTNDELNFTDDELVRANQVILNIAQYGEDERTRLRAAIYIRDDKKGRLDVVKAMSGLNINVLTFNEHMQQALDAMKRAKVMPSTKELGFVSTERDSAKDTLVNSHSGQNELVMSTVEND